MTLMHCFARKNADRQYVMRLVVLKQFNWPAAVYFQM